MFCSKQTTQNTKINLQYKVCCCFFLSMVQLPFLQRMRAITVVVDQMPTCTAKYSMWSHSPCVVFPLTLFISIQRYSHRWKRIQSTSQWGSQPFAGSLGNTGWLGFQVTQDQTHPKRSGSLQKRKRLPTTPLPLPLSYPRNKRKGGAIFFPEPWYLALSDEQRQQYVSTLLEKTQMFIQSSAFYRKPPPPNTKKSDIASCMHFLFSYTYIYICTYTYIYVCGRTHVYI